MTEKLAPCYRCKTMAPLKSKMVQGEVMSIALCDDCFKKEKKS